MTEFMLMIEFMLQTESRRFRFVGWADVGNGSPSENQGVCGVTGDPVLEQSIVSVVQDSRLRRGEGQGWRSDAEVLHEGTMDVFENNEWRGDRPVVSDIVGELFGISDISGSSNAIPEKATPSGTGTPCDMVSGEGVPGS